MRSEYFSHRHLIFGCYSYQQQAKRKECISDEKSSSEIDHIDPSG